MDFLFSLAEITSSSGSLRNHRGRAKNHREKAVATGKVEPRNEIQIKPQIAGIIDEIYKEAGEMVRKEEVIARIKVIPDMVTLNAAESRVKVAEVNLNQSQTDFDRQKGLYENKVISREEFEKANPALFWPNRNTRQPSTTWP